MRSQPRCLETMLNCKLVNVSWAFRGRGIVSLLVLVDHVCNTPALINDLGPTVTVEVLGAQLTG